MTAAQAVLSRLMVAAVAAVEVAVLRQMWVGWGCHQTAGQGIDWAH